MKAKEAKLAEPSGAPQIVRTFCPPHCLMSCGILAYVKDGRLVKLEPAEFPDSRFDRICLKGLAQLGHVYHPERLKYPMKRVGERGKGGWQRISWDAAFSTMAAAIRGIITKYEPKAFGWFRGAGSLGILSDTPKRLASLVQGTLFGEGLEDCIDTAGPQASIDTFGTAWWASPDKKHFYGGSSEVADCLNSKLVVVWGANFAETAPHNMRFVFDAMENGAKLVVVDPRFSPTASKADVWLPIVPGTDTCLALGLANVIIENHLYDEDFLIRHTVGPFLVRQDSRQFLRERDVKAGASTKYMVWNASTQATQPFDIADEPSLTGDCTVAGIRCQPAFQKLADLAAKYDPMTVERITGVPVRKIKQVALDYATSKPAIFGLLYGLDRWFFGNLTYRAIFALAAITGQLGMHGGGFFLSDPTLGLSDDPWMFPEGKKPAFMNAMDMYEAIAHGKPYSIKALWIYRGNLFRYSNAKKIVGELLPALEFIVVADKFMTPTAEYADLVLPVCSSFETDDLHVGPFPYIQLQQKTIEPLHESKSDFEITSGVARRLGLGKYFRGGPAKCLKQIAELNGVSLEQLKREGVLAADVERPYAAFLDRRFPTPSGRVEFYVERCIQFGQELPVWVAPDEASPNNSLANKYPLVFLQSHSRFHVHTSFANLPWLLEINPEPFVEMNPKDAEKRHIRDGDWAFVFNDRGRVKVKARLSEAVRPGVVDIHHGWWRRQFAQGWYQDLTKEKANPALLMPNFAYFDCLVEVKKA